MTHFLKNTPKILSLSTLFLLASMHLASAAFLLNRLPGGDETKAETRPYAGLSWSLGAGFIPALQLGVVSESTHANGSTEGADLFAQINFVDGAIKPGKVELNYLDGDRNVQGAAGVGYNFLTWNPLVDVGVNAPYVNASVDANVTQFLAPSWQTFTPSVTFKTQGQFEEPVKNNCQHGYHLVGNTCHANIL